MKLPFLPVLLWTDALIYLLLFMIAIVLLLKDRWPHLVRPWASVVRSKSGMASLVVLSFYVAAGLLDSVHFRPLLPGGGAYSVEVLSLLDAACEKLRDQSEKTYSAPFSAYSYAKETVTLADGSQARRFPRLKYGGAALVNPERDEFADIFKTVAEGSLLAFISWGAVALMLAALLRRGESVRDSAQKILRGKTEYPWRVMLATLLIILLLLFPAALLSGHYHILGTDKVGQDVFYLALKSIRTGLVIGTLTTLVMLPVSILLGISAGFFGGWVDDAIQYLYTTLNSIPSVLLIAAAVLLMQVYIDAHPELFETMAERADLRLFFLCFILGLTNWTGLCRLLRAEALKLREMEYILAAQAFGVSRLRIIGRHLLPNVMHIVLISVVMEFSSLVLAEAVLSYVGVGVDPSMKSFGTMINAARLEMAREPAVWWSLAAAFFFMFVLVLFANLLADAVRDAFDPRTGNKS